MTAEENIRFREDIIKKQFRECLGYELNLENPQTFNEKIQWLKLYYYDPLMTICVDKYAVREYIKEKIGEEYLIPLIAAWDNVEDIDFDSLPNQFVLKVNWGWGQNIIVKDKSKLNIEETKNKLKKWTENFNNNYYGSYELAYKYIKPKIICEKYIYDKYIKNLTVYKMFCFNKKPCILHVILDDKTENETTNFYDLNWNKLNIRQLYDNCQYVEKPINFELMINLSEKLSYNFDIFVRVDFYEANGKLFFSECAFYPDSGMGKFEPVEWDYKFGELLKLPKEKKIEYDHLSKKELIEQTCNLEKISIDYKNQTKLLTDINKKYDYIRNKSFIPFGILNDGYYITVIILGIKVTIKKKRLKNIFK